MKKESEKSEEEEEEKEEKDEDNLEKVEEEAVADDTPMVDIEIDYAAALGGGMSEEEKKQIFDRIDAL